MQSYSDVLKYLEKDNRQKHLLLGNGFSMAYDPSIFSYNALSDFVQNLDNELLIKLFEIVNTKNFELIMQQLDNFTELSEAFGANKNFIGKIRSASSELKNSLIDAIKELHPEHVFTIPEEKSKACASFLDEYLSKDGNVFSANYDLLLYWVVLRNQLEKTTDGFGRDVEDSGEWVPDDEVVYSELRWGKHKESQIIHHIHGTLSIFDTGIEIIKEEYESGQNLLEKIKSRIENKEYPVFVTAGTANEKLNHIMHNKYLSFCYDKLCAIKGSLVTFGFNFGDYDTHIIDALNKAAGNNKRNPNRLLSVYIGTYSDDDVKHIKRIENKFRCKVNMFDAKTAPVWIGNDKT